MKVRGVSTISKVSPLELPSTKHNNFMTKSLRLARQLKFLILVESLIGICRLHLLQCSRFVRFLSYIYVSTLTVSAMYIILQNTTISPTHLILRDMVSVEYVVLVIMAMFFKRHNFLRLFQNLSTFDDLLNITGDIRVLNTTTVIIYWTLGSLCYSVLEFIMFKFCMKESTFSNSVFFFFYIIITLTHDLEHVFFCTLLRMIYTRIIIVRTHIFKVFLMDDGKLMKSKMKLNKIESLWKNTKLDITSLHKVYELLHKCSDQLNTIMSIPMLFMLFTSGIITTVLLKFMVTIIQTRDKMQSATAVGLVVYIMSRCIKYSFLVFVPCYYVSITSAQVLTIRNTLHHAVNTMQLDKLERRKVKAFYLLTKENKFKYALAGVINLNMRLPLSYLSICTTYLVIIIQFSKFID